MLRQGDVLLVPLTCVPDDLHRENRAYADRWIIARGEQTGHMHQIKSRAAEVFRGAGDARVLRTSESVSLTHDEHQALDIPPGDYLIKQQREWEGTHSKMYSD